jgi:hypothetical protein
MGRREINTGLRLGRTIQKIYSCMEKSEFITMMILGTECDILGNNLQLARMIPYFSVQDLDT